MRGVNALEIHEYDGSNSSSDEQRGSSPIDLVNAASRSRALYKIKGKENAHFWIKRQYFYKRITVLVDNSVNVSMSNADNVAIFS